MIETQLKKVFMCLARNDFITYDKAMKLVSKCSRNYDKKIKMLAEMDVTTWLVNPDNPLTGESEVMLVLPELKPKPKKYNDYKSIW